ncbi:hypothetical protein GCM10009624_25090 [Gordonia sinesedis]
MTKRRVLIAVGAIVLVVGLAAGIALWAVDDPSPAVVDEQTLLLQESDFPSGYQVEFLDRDSAARQPADDLSPRECYAVLGDQFRRNQGSKREGLIATSNDDNEPRYTQSVVTGGESVDDAMGAVRACPKLSQSTPQGRLSVTQFVETAAPDCGVDATYVRGTMSLEGSTSESEPARSITAYIQSGSLTSQLNRTGYGETDDEFCRLVTRAKAKLDERDD